MKKRRGVRRRTVGRVKSSAGGLAMRSPHILAPFAFDYGSFTYGSGCAVHADCFEWLGKVAADSLHAIVTAPPYGVKEYDFDQIEKRGNGQGGIWRIPPSFDGHTRAPLPRFTALNPKERESLRHFF